MSAAAAVPASGNLISEIGHYGGLHAPYRVEDLMGLELKSVQAGVNLAKQVGIATATEHLVARDILPDKDFVDISGNTISGRQWRQPWSGTWGNGPYALESDNTIYKINRTVDFHNKIYVFWGIRYVNRGLAEPQPVVNSDSITWRDAANTYDTWHTEGADVHREMYAFQPILVKNYVEYSITMRPRVDASGAYDTFQILGKIIEPAGESIMGSPVKG